MTPFPFPNPLDILTEDDVYCSCLAKTLCHVPVPVTVGFYAPFGCRLHLMLDKIMSEYLHVLSVGEGQEAWSLVPALFSKSRPFPVTSIPTKHWFHVVGRRGHA